MKKIILIFSFLVCNIFAWQTYETEAGGVGIYQNCVAGENAGQIMIFKENNSYKLYFVTQKYELQAYDPWNVGIPRVTVKCENDKGKGEEFFIQGSYNAVNATQFGFKANYLSYLSNSKWVKFSFSIQGSGLKPFKFDFNGFNTAIKKVKE